MTPSKKTIRCPQCHGPSTWEENPYKPFCSERCRMIDLGNWINGGYAIPDDRKDMPQDLSEEEMAFLDKETKSPTIH